jgi:hypothetical protein
MGEAAVWRTERINQIGYVGAVARYRVFALTGTAEWSVGSTKIWHDFSCLGGTGRVARFAGPLAWRKANCDLWPSNGDMAGRALPVPVGESPTGTGGSPVPPNPKGMELPGVAARNGIPLLRPLPADDAVYHASNYDIVSNQVQNKVKKSAGERDSPPAPGSGGGAAPPQAAIAGCRRDKTGKGLCPQIDADGRRWGKRAFTGANRGNRVCSPLPLFPHVQLASGARSSSERAFTETKETKQKASFVILVCLCREEGGDNAGMKRGGVA